MEKYLAVTYVVVYTALNQGLFIYSVSEFIPLTMIWYEALTMIFLPTYFIVRVRKVNRIIGVISVKQITKQHWKLEPRNCWTYRILYYPCVNPTNFF